jgi:hypothetical protein
LGGNFNPRNIPIFLRLNFRPPKTLRKNLISGWTLTIFMRRIPEGSGIAIDKDT